MSRVKRMVAVLATSALLVGAVGSAALAVNDPIVPGDECSASTQAVGHPTFANQQDNPQEANFGELVRMWGITCWSIEKAKSVLGYRPRYNFPEFFEALKRGDQSHYPYAELPWWGV